MARDALRLATAAEIEQHLFDALAPPIAADRGAERRVTIMT